MLEYGLPKGYHVANLLLAHNNINKAEDLIRKCYMEMETIQSKMPDRIVSFLQGQLDRWEFYRKAIYKIYEKGVPANIGTTEMAEALNGLIEEVVATWNELGWSRAQLSACIEKYQEAAVRYRMADESWNISDKLFKRLEKKLENCTEHTKSAHQRRDDLRGKLYRSCDRLARRVAEIVELAMSDSDVAWGWE